MDFLTVIKVLVVGNVIIDLIAFAPQLRKLIKATSALSDVSITTWVLWTYTSVVWMMYIIYTTDDWLLIASTISIAVACTGVLWLAVWNQYFRFKGKESCS